MDAEETTIASWVHLALDSGLVTWDGLGVLKVDDSFGLLEIAEEATPGTKAISRPGKHFRIQNIAGAYMNISICIKL
jgi:hypothetical protein